MNFCAILWNTNTKLKDMLTSNYTKAFNQNNISRCNNILELAIPFSSQKKPIFYTNLLTDRIICTKW